MADLTARLGLTEGTNRVIDDPASPSAFGAVADFAKDAIAGYSNLKDDLSRKAQSRAAAEEKAAKAQIAYDVGGVASGALAEVAANGQARIQQEQQQQPSFGEEAPPTNKPLGGVFDEAPATVSPEMEREVVGSAKRAASVVTAVQQGKMPEITVASAVTARFRALREKYPQHNEYLIEMFAKFGLDKSVSPEIADAEDERNFLREQGQAARTAQTKLEDDAVAAAQAALGPESLTMSRPQLIVHGLTRMKSDRDLEILGKTADITLKNASATAEQTKVAQSDHDERVLAHFGTDAHDNAAPYITSVMNIVSTLQKNPDDVEAQQRFQQLGPKLNLMIQQGVSNAYALAVSEGGYKGTEEAFRTRVNNMYKPMLDAFGSGDLSFVSANTTALKGIEDSFKMDRTKALPIFLSLQAAGMTPGEMPAVMKAVETNSQLQKDLKAEMEGFVTDWGKDRASTRVLNMIKIMRGDKTFREMTGEQAASAVRDLSQAIIPLAKGYSRGLGVDGNKVVNTVGELSIAASRLTPTSGSLSFLLATRAFAGEGTRLALIKTLSDKAIGGEDAEMARATVQASRAASASLAQNIRFASRKANESSPYFKMVWDQQNGKWTLDKSGHRKAIAEAHRGSGNNMVGKLGMDPRLARLQKMEAPEEIQNLIMAGNVNVANAVALGPYDESTPKATDIQLRNWYGQETPIPGEKSLAAKSINPSKEASKQLDNLEKMIDQGFDGMNNPVKKPRGAPRDFGGEAKAAKLDAPIRAAASKYGIPDKLAFALIGSESSFRPGIKGKVITDKKSMHYGDRAIGLGQVMKSTAAMYGVTNRESLSADQEIDLAFRYLSDLKKNNPGENWEDAVSRYFSGRNLARAVKEGANDKLTDVLSYVRGIVD